MGSEQIYVQVNIDNLVTALENSADITSSHVVSIINENDLEAEVLEKIVDVISDAEIIKALGSERIGRLVLECGRMKMSETKQLCDSMLKGLEEFQKNLKQLGGQK